MVDSYYELVSGKLGKLVQEKHEDCRRHGEMGIDIRRGWPTIARIVIRIVVVPHYRREFTRDTSDRNDL